MAAALCAAGAAASDAHADEPSTPVEVVVEGERTDRPGEPGRAGSVVDDAALEERLPRSAPDALRYEPGVYVQQTAHGQGSPYVRGQTGQRVLLLFDGIRLNNSTFRQGPNQYFFTVDTQTLHRIEIVRGGASTLYGSDAMAGVIDAFPAEPRLDLGATGVVARPRVLVRGATADDELGFRSSIDLQLDPRLRLLIGAGARDVDELESGGPVCSPGTEDCSLRSRERSLVPRFAPDGQTQLGTGFRELTADGRVVYSLGEGERLAAAAYLYRQYDAPRTDQCPPPYASARECLTYDEQFRTLAYLRYSGLRGPAWARTAESTLSYQRQHERRTRSRPRSFVDNLGRDDVDTVGATLRVRTERHAFTSWLVGALSYGADLYADFVSSGAWTEFTDNQIVVAGSRGQYVDGSSYLQGGGYLDLESVWLDRLTVRLGGRVGTAVANAPADAASGTVAVDTAWPTVGARVGLEAAIVPGLSLLGNVDRSFRAPNLDDLTSRQQAGPGFQIENPALGPEAATTLEVGVRGGVPSVFEADAWLFRSILQDAIVRATRPMGACPPQTPQCLSSWFRYQLVNLGESATIDGVELSARGWLPGGFSLRATLAYTFGEGPNPQERPTDPAVAFDETVPLSRVPPLNGTAEARWESPAGTYVGAGLRWATTQDRLAPSDLSDARIPAGGTPGFAVVDARMGWRFGEAVRASLVFENLLDSAYRYHGSSINGPGRGMVVTLEGGL